jgi:hypothetical protein
MSEHTHTRNTGGGLMSDGNGDGSPAADRR